jgi:hypothetical protein
MTPSRCLSCAYSSSADSADAVPSRRKACPTHSHGATTDNRAAYHSGTGVTGRSTVDAHSDSNATHEAVAHAVGRGGAQEGREGLGNLPVAHLQQRLQVHHRHRAVLLHDFPAGVHGSQGHV